LIIGYHQYQDENSCRIIKLDSEGELVWEISLPYPNNYINWFDLKKGIDNNFYACIHAINEEGYTFYTFYLIDNAGSILPGWSAGLIISECGLLDWCVDDSGNLLVLNNSFEMNLELEKYNSENQQLFSEIVVSSDTYLEWSSLPASVKITNEGQYLCSWALTTILIDTEGTEIWELDKHGDYNIVSRGMLIGENCFYELTNSNELYQFSYEPDLNLNYQLYSETEEILGIKVKSDDGVRIATSSGSGYLSWQTYRLVDYNVSGVMESPIDGWYHCEAFGSFYHPVFLQGSAGDFIWAALNHDENLNQELSFISVSESGQILTGEVPVVIRAGLEQNLTPLEIYVNEDIETILLKDTGNPSDSYGGNRIVLQKLGIDGEPVDQPSGEILFSGVNKLLCRKDNLVLFSSRIDEQTHIHLIDLETGNLVWGEEGYIIEQGNPVYTVAGGFFDDIALISITS